MKRLQIVREKDDGFQTLGKLRIIEDNKIVATFSCIEPSWKNNKRRTSCIPTGTYLVKKRWSPKFKHHFHILDVLNRSWILIHAGNFRENSTGCILVGHSHRDINGDGVLDLASSKAALRDLLNAMPDRFSLGIKNVD